MRLRRHRIPHRPDLWLPAPPVGRRRPAVLILALALAVASASAIGASLAISERSTLRDRASASTPSPSASPSEAVVASTTPAFRFLDQVGGEPRRWDSCEGLTYRINISGAPPGGVDD